jgi:hypothetical protein
MFELQRLRPLEVPWRSAAPPQPAGPAARGGEIILRKRWRIVFIAGLAGTVLLGFFLSLWGR